MSTFNAPTLFETIDRVLYESQLNANFQKIQLALNNLQNIIPSVTGSGLQPSNLLWVDKCIVPDGVLGTEAFTPIFSDETDGSLTLQVTHPDQSESGAIIQNVYHRSTTPVTFDLVAIGTGAAQSMVIGLKSLGAPALEIVVEEEDTDGSYDLPLYSFDMDTIGGFLVTSNLRRASDVLMNREAWLALWNTGESITFNVEGQLGGQTGRRAYGFLAPYDLKVIEAQFHLGVAPSAGETVEVQLVSEDNDTDADVLSGTATWAAGATGLVTVAGWTGTETLVTKGSKVYLDVVQADTLTDQPSASDLTATILVQKIFHEIR